MILANNERASSEPLPNAAPGFRRHRRGSGSREPFRGVESSATIIMEPQEVTVRDPEQRLYPVILRNTGRQHILFKIKIRRRQVEDWIVYPVMGVILPQSTQTIYLTRKTSVESLYRSQSGPMLVETSVVDTADLQQSPQELWDSISGAGKVNVKSQVLPIEVRLEDDLNCSAPNSPITPAISRSPNSSVIPWLSSLEEPLAPPTLPTPIGVSLSVAPPTPVTPESRSAPPSPMDWYIPPPPPYEKAVGYSYGSMDLKAVSLQRKKALRVVD
ncbi:hypothetical protein M407DRAFT_214294 [Tulasnella calospora MUT 4182]|uniref:MSP domain-containing protein n=1 Tax=Tulasnella calospora MUT 4182 TaxID=1051891 RepID=A0A0C3QUZ6_9AGAM|nr:hypothetical protein M407DRAFT_214294 [Tulasnella calospora MUT 4182]